MTTTIKRIILRLVILALAIQFVDAGNVHKSISGMQEDLRPYLAECHNVDWGYINPIVAYVDQLCYETTPTSYVEYKKTIHIELVFQEFKRYDGHTKPVLSVIRM